jgi:hypothetical protein
MLQATRRLDADVICAAAFPLNHVLYPFRRPDPRPVVLMHPPIPQRLGLRPAQPWA